MTERLPPEQVYARIGSAGFERLIDAFYRQVAEDDILRPMYPEDDMDGAARRLRLFLVQYFGGPTTYSQERGHPRLRARHLPFTIDQQARDRWMALMNNALTEADLPPEVVVTLQDYLENAATFMINARADNILMP